MDITFIPDGYTVDGYIAGIDRQYGSLRFKFRPAIPKQRSALHRLIQDAKTPQDEEAVLASALAKFVVKWDLADPDGNVQPIKISIADRLQTHLSTKLFRIIMGDLPSDADPDAPERDNQEEEAERLERALSGDSAEATEAETEGN